MGATNFVNEGKRCYKGSFSLRLSLYILLVTAAVFITAIFMTYRSAREYVQGEVVEHSQVALDNTLLQISTMLQEVETTLESTSVLVADARHRAEDIYAVTEQLLLSNPNIVGSAVAFVPNYFADRGIYYAPYSYRRDGVIAQKQLGSSEYNYHEMEWFSVPLRNGTPYWSEPYYDRGGGDAILATYSYPLSDADGNIYAIFTADISIEQFAEQVRAIKPYPGAYNFMISRRGAFLAHSRQEALISETVFENAVRFNEPELAELANRMVALERGVSIHRRNGVDYYVLYAPVDRTGWSVAVACPYVDVFSGVYELRNTIVVIFTIGLLLIAVLCYLTIRRLTRPLKRLTLATSDIAAGRFDRITPEVKSRDEMRQLRDSFENMRISLIRYVDELRTTVEQKERMMADLRIARDIQLGMLPKDDALVEYARTVALSSRLMAAKEVGGDLYNFFVKDGRLHFIVGDVSGKGVPAALVMAVICRMFRMVASIETSPADMLSMLNRALTENNDSNMFCTAFVGSLDIKSGILSYANAGHNPPVLFGREHAPSVLSIETNIPLGVMAEYEFVGGEYCMARGTHFLVYTDGVTEAANAQGELFGQERLLRFVAQHSDEVVDALVAELKDFSRGCEQSDDIAVLDIKLKP